MSQLGMMVIAVGLSSYNIALFHLVNHAFYKGLLFLGAGAVIHAVADNQDFRKYGGLISYLPLTYSVMLIASLSLVAFPFMTGFYSKDFIIESAFGKYYISSIAVYYIASIGAMFTTLYSVKVLYLTFLSNPNGPIVNYKQAHAAHEADIYMSLPLIILAVFSIYLGYNIFGFFNQRFLVEMFYNKYISGLVLDLGAQTTKVMDKGSVEKFGPFGLEKSVTDISNSINKLSTGVVTSYALYILVGLIFYISILYLTNNNDDSLLFIIIIFAIINSDKVTRK